MQRIELYFPGEPKAVQSFRFTKEGRRFQPKATTDWKGYIRLAALEQLPQDFRLLDCPLALSVGFAFPPLAAFPKVKRAALEAGAMLWKSTRPDLTDNLMKGLCDALTGIVWIDDARICKVASAKTYSLEPGITVIVEPLEAMLLSIPKEEELL